MLLQNTKPHGNDNFNPIASSRVNLRKSRLRVPATESKETANKQNEKRTRLGMHSLTIVRPSALLIDDRHRCGGQEKKSPTEELSLPQRHRAVPANAHF